MAANKTQAHGELHRGLKSRHVMLIALGGIIGSCYFLGTGAVISQVGPGVFLAYILGGFIVYLTMLCMGELAVAIPVSASFITYAARFISPTFACGSGWSYWINWVVYIPAECVAAGIIMHLFTGVNGYIWAVSFGLLITYINLASVRVFGEVEFWLALIKIFALIGFVVLSLLIFFGMIHTAHHVPAKIGTQYLMGNHGLFPHGGMSLLTAMVLLLVNYQGSEIIGLTAGESDEPARIIPKTIRRVMIRVLCLYIVPVFCLVLIFPWQKAGISNSIFSEALNSYGFHWAGAIMSFVTLTAALSCANSGFYAAVRALRSLAQEGMAPQFFASLNKKCSPRYAVLATLVAIWTLLGAGFFFSQTSLYIALLLVSGFTGTVCWISICWSQLSFRKQYVLEGNDVKNLLYKTPWHPYTGIIAIILMSFCLLFLFFNEDITYRWAFIISAVNVLVPMGIYKIRLMSRGGARSLKLQNQ